MKDILLVQWEMSRALLFGLINAFNMDMKKVIYDSISAPKQVVYKHRTPN